MSKPWVWLEGLFIHQKNRLDKDTITIQYNNKNYENLIQKNKLKIKTLTNRKTFMTSQQALAKIIGQIHRIRVTTHSYLNRFLAVKQFCVVAKYLNYSQNSISNALRHVALTTNESIWKIIDNKIVNELV